MYDIATDHASALGPALAAVALLWLGAQGVRLLARRRVAAAVRFAAAYDAAPVMARLAAWLMLLSAAIHLALVPGHDGVTGLLFIVDGVGFAVLATAAFVTSWWRRVATVWLLATIAAYIIWVIAGWETPDQIGIVCKLIELVALGLVTRLAPPSVARLGWFTRARKAVAYPLIVSVMTLGIWVGGLAHPDALHTHAGAVLQATAAVASDEQRAAADRLLAETRTAIAPYADPAQAIAAGFKPGPVSSAEPLVHFENKANASAILNPTHPQALVYATTGHGLRLVGAMYQMQRIGQVGPDPGGPLTQWHQHEGICFSPFGFEFTFETPFWTCPVGSTSITTPPMLHVWIIDNGRSGPFSADLDKSVQQALRRS